MNCRIVRSSWVLLLLILVAAVPVFAQAPGRYMVEFHQFGPDSVRAVTAAGGSPVHQFPELGVVAAWLPETALKGLQNNPNVKLIEVDPLRQLMAQETPYGIPMVEADLLSDSKAGGCKVCIIDSGYYINHEDLQSANVTGYTDGGTGDPFVDGCGHGTHVAGTVAALNNTAGVIGVLPSGNINLHIVKVFGNDCGWAYSSDLIDALNRCRDAGSNVVSMSLGGTFKSVTEDRAFSDAYAAGVLSIAAAGNDGNNRYSYPASYDSVVSVAAIDSTETVADFSQFNSQVELAAPGVSVLSTVPWLTDASVTTTSGKYSGTAMDASPSTSGTSGNLVDGGICDVAGNWTGNVVLCQRGSISFKAKVDNVAAGGGVAAVIYNNVSGGFSGTCDDGTGTKCTLPAIGISMEDGDTIKNSGTDLGASSTVVSQTTKPASGYEAWNGTSMATPHVSGVAALVWSHDMTWTNDQVRKALQATAKDLGAAGRDDYYGYGLVKAKQALDYLGGGTSCTDADNDGYCTTDGDCNDSDATVNPGAAEVCGDGIDNNCDGVVDEGCSTGGDDTTAPVISSVSSANLKGNKFEISWTTDEASNSEVTFTCCGTYSDTNMVTSHTMSFNGSKGQLYEYWVSSTDAAGNKGTAGPFYHQND